VAKSPLFKTQRGQKRAAAVAMIVVLGLSVGVAVAYVSAVKPRPMTFAAMRVGFMQVSVPATWIDSSPAKHEAFKELHRFTDPQRRTRSITVVAATTEQPIAVLQAGTSFDRLLQAQATDPPDSAAGQSPQPQTRKRISPVRTQDMIGIRITSIGVLPDRLITENLIVLTRDRQHWFALTMKDTLPRAFQSNVQIDENLSLFNFIASTVSIEPDPRLKSETTPNPDDPDKPAPPANDPENDASP